MALDTKETPPLLMALDGSRWESTAAEAYDFGTTNRAEAGSRMHFLREVRLAADARGSIWMVGEYGYRLRMFSPVGQLRGTLLVGKGLPDLTERPAAEAAQEAARVAKEIGVRPSPDSLRVSAVHSVAGIAVAKDGRVYLLIEAAAGGATPLVLDRFDPAGMMLERIALDRRLPTGHLSLAVGRDGLYLAGFTGSDGLWRLPWEALDGARWEGVPAATYNGEMAATINSMDRRAMS